MSKNQQLEWEWKDSNRRWWIVRAETTGEIQNQDELNPDGDWQWSFDLFNEENKLVYEGYFVGQLDHPPKLKDLLYAWQCDVASIVIDGSRHEVYESFRQREVK